MRRREASTAADALVEAAGGEGWGEEEGDLDVEEDGLVFEDLEVVDPEAGEEGGPPPLGGAAGGHPAELGGDVLGEGGGEAVGDLVGHLFRGGGGVAEGFDFDLGAEGGFFDFVSEGATERQDAGC